MLLHSDLNAARLPIPPRPQVWKREKHLAKRCRHLKRKICKIGRLLTHAYLPSAAGLCANVLRPARAAAIKATVANPDHDPAKAITATENRFVGAAIRREIGQPRWDQTKQIQPPPRRLMGANSACADLSDTVLQHQYARNANPSSRPNGPNTANLLMRNAW
jgi:hypothetical protein